MVLSELDLEIIVSETKRTTNDERFIGIVKNHLNKEFIDLLFVEKNIVNKIPNGIIETFIDDILRNYDKVLAKCSIDDLSLMAKVLKACNNRYRREELAQKAMPISNLSPELLYKTFPDAFTLYTVFNHSTKPLSENFILSTPDFLRYVNEGFFKTNTITKNFMIKAISQMKMDSKYHTNFFNDLNEALNKGYKQIEADALPYCIDAVVVANLLKHYTFEEKELKYIYKNCFNDETVQKNFIENQPIRNKFISKFVPKDLLHYYIVHNPFVNDELIIEFHRKGYNINWPYIYRNLDLSKHVDFANYLCSKDQSHLVSLSLLELNKSDKGVENLNAILDLPIPEETIMTLVYDRTHGIEVHIHNR